jgi:hypothetical protein
MAMSWANFNIPLVYVDGGIPDTCIIVLMASGVNPTNNDYLWVDNLSFSGSVTSVEEKNSSISVGLYPNPVSDNLTIELNSLTYTTLKIELVDLTGKIMKNKIADNFIGNSKYSMDITDISKGIYFLKVSGDRFVETKKLVIN